MPTTPIIQFGTSRFLQAHADLFVSEALETGNALGPITVVHSSGTANRMSRLAGLAAPEGFPVKVRGIGKGKTIDTEVRVTSVKRALSANTDWEEITRIVAEEAEIILSNTSDAGFRAAQADAATEFHPAMSYPEKLTRLLWARFQATGAPLQVMPTELIPDNGDYLRKLVAELARRFPAEFQSWLQSHVTFVNSLVDRIVSEAIEPAGAVAEPYALWAIEDQSKLIIPCRHPSVQIVPSLKPVETRKLFILNLGHSYMVSSWLARNRSGAQLVRGHMADPDLRADLETLYEKEVLPGFAAAGMASEAEAYVSEVMDRFENPFLDHNLQDIAQNHCEKLQRRIGTFISWARENGNDTPMPRLEGALANGGVH